MRENTRDVPEQREESGAEARAESDERLRVRLAAELGASIEEHYRQSGAQDICIEGRVRGRETGALTWGILRALRIMGRNDTCSFLELDPTSGEPLGAAVFHIKESGTIRPEGLALVTLAKATAISAPENSEVISFERFVALKHATPS